MILDIIALCTTELQARWQQKILSLSKMFIKINWKISANISWKKFLILFIGQESHTCWRKHLILA